MARSFGACSPAPARSRSWESRRGRFRSRSTSQAAGCRASPWSGFPIRRSGNRASGCARRSSTRASSSRCSGSPPTSRPPTCARPAPASTWRSRRRCWRPPASCRRSGWGGWRSPASWRSTARSGRCPGSWRWRRPRGSSRRRRSRSRRPTRAEAALAGEPRVVPLVHLKQLALLGTEDEPPRSPTPGMDGKRRRARGSGPRRSAGAAVPPLRPGGGGCRRPQPADHRPAGRRQVARRAPPAVDHAPARPLRGDGGAPDRERLRPLPSPGSSANPPLQGSPSHDLHRRAGGRRLAAPGGRGDAVPPRGAVPRRAGGVLPRGARGAAPAPGGGPGDHRSRASRGRAPVPLHARRGVQSVPLRPGRGVRGVRLPAGVDAPLPRQAQRRARRPDRHRDLGRAPERRGDGSGARLRFGERSGAGDRRPASARSAGLDRGAATRR